MDTSECACEWDFDNTHILQISFEPKPSCSSSLPLAFNASRRYNVPIHHSRPNSPNKLFLNFNGQVVTGSAWNNNGGRGSDGGYSPITGMCASTHLDCPFTAHTGFLHTHTSRIYFLVRLLDSSIQPHVYMNLSHIKRFSAHPYCSCAVLFVDTPGRSHTVHKRTERCRH